MAVTPEHLASCVRRATAATTYDEAAARAVIERCLRGQLDIGPFSDHSRRFAQAVAPLRSLITPEALSRLSGALVAVVPAAINAAVAVPSRTQPHILVFEGLIETSLVSLEMSHALSSLPAALELVCPSRRAPDVSALSLASILFSGLLHRYSSWGEALPSFRHLISAERRPWIMPGFQSAMWWVLLHELGHIVLGHGYDTGDGARLSVSELVVAESLTRWQEEELEADDFAMHCLAPEAKGLHHAWINTALHPQMMLDALVSLREGTHPLTVNRLHRARERSLDLTGFVDGDDMPGHLARHGETFLQLESAHNDTRARGEQPLFDRLSRREILSWLDELVPAFEAEGVSLASVADPNPGWGAAMDAYAGPAAQP